MSESTLSAPPVKTCREQVALSDTPQVITSREARRFIRAAEFVAVYVTTSEHGAADILDTSKARVLKMLSRRDRVWCSVLFGTVIFGRPEPI